jgi:hypothetical protein
MLISAFFFHLLTQANVFPHWYADLFYLLDLYLAHHFGLRPLQHLSHSYSFSFPHPFKPSYSTLALLVLLECCAFLNSNYTIIIALYGLSYYNRFIYQQQQYNMNRSMLFSGLLVLLAIHHAQAFFAPPEEFLEKVMEKTGREYCSVSNIETTTKHL